MANWIDGQAPDRFDGCLIVLNIGNNNYNKFDKQFIETVQSHVADSIAKGHLILYLFDSGTGGQQHPEIFDTAEGISHIRMIAGITNRIDTNFKLMPNDRMAEFKEIAGDVRNGLPFNGPVSITGSCKIDGVSVLLPLTEIK